MVLSIKQTELLCIVIVPYRLNCIVMVFGLHAELLRSDSNQKLNYHGAIFGPEAKTTVK